jgi:hypothetical protein
MAFVSLPVQCCVISAYPLPGGSMRFCVGCTYKLWSGVEAKGLEVSRCVLAFTKKQPEHFLLLYALVCIRMVQKGSPCLWAVGKGSGRMGCWNWPWKLQGLDVCHAGRRLPGEGTVSSQNRAVPTRKLIGSTHLNSLGSDLWRLPVQGAQETEAARVSLSTES